MSLFLKCASALTLLRYVCDVCVGADGVGVCRRPLPRSCPRPRWWWCGDVLLLGAVRRHHGAGEAHAVEQPLESAPEQHREPREPAHAGPDQQRAKVAAANHRVPGPDGGAQVRKQPADDGPDDDRRLHVAARAGLVAQHHERDPRRDRAADQAPQALPQHQQVDRTPALDGHADVAARAQRRQQPAQLATNRARKHPEAQDAHRRCCCCQQSAWRVPRCGGCRRWRRERRQGLRNAFVVVLRVACCALVFLCAFSLALCLPALPRRRCRMSHVVCLLSHARFFMPHLSSLLPNNSNNSSISTLQQIATSNAAALRRSPTRPTARA